MQETIVTTTPEETWAVAGRMADRLPPRVVLALHGDLGSGKTCFIQGLARALGVARPVTSPTFTMIHEYRGRRNLVHIDLYRVSSPDELLMLGFEDFFEQDGIVAIEWAERAGDLVPVPAVHLGFTVLASHDHREISARHSGTTPLLH